MLAQRFNFFSWHYCERCLRHLFYVVLLRRDHISGGAGDVRQHVVVKERERGYDEATFVILNPVGESAWVILHTCAAIPGWRNLLDMRCIFESGSGIYACHSRRGKE